MHDYMDNISNDVTNKKSLLEQLVTNTPSKPQPLPHKPQLSSLSQMKSIQFNSGSLTEAADEVEEASTTTSENAWNMATYGCTATRYITLPKAAVVIFWSS